MCVTLLSALSFDGDHYFSILCNVVAKPLQFLHTLLGDVRGCVDEELRARLHFKHEVPVLVCGLGCCNVGHFTCAPALRFWWKSLLIAQLHHAPFACRSN